MTDSVRAAPIVAVVGPTATGKSHLALDLAERLDGEVVNADALQLYRGMDIGTAKLPPGERRGIPHHQLDVLDVTQEASVAAYQAGSRRDLEAIQRRGGVPLLVGGSGLYVRAALDHLDIPPTDPRLRAELEAQADEVGARAMHARLAATDPTAATAIDPDNARRIVRALEVIELTDRPFSASMPRREFLRPAAMLGLRLDRTALDERIGRRVEQMWRTGLLEEAERLLHHGLREGITASRGIGYRQAIAVLDGVTTRPDAVHDTARATRRLARRQESWFRADPRITWLDADDPRLLDRALSVVSANPEGAVTPSGPSGIPENG